MANTTAAWDVDRFFPVEFMRRPAADRLGLPVDVIPESHSAALTQPQALVASHQDLFRRDGTGVA